MDTINLKDIAEATAVTKLFKCQEIYDVKGIIKEFPTIFPTGEIDFDFGEVINMDAELQNHLVNSFRAKVYGQRVPITIEHRDGEAQGWIDDVFIENGEVKIKVDWLADGIALLESRKYAYLSPEIWLNYKIGNQVYPIILRAVSFTNFPRIKIFNNVLEGFSEKKEEAEKELTLSELLTQLKSISGKLAKHPDLYRKNGAPRVKSAFNLILDSLKKYEKKEEKTMSEETKNETVETKAVEVGKIDFTEQFKEELTKMKEELSGQYKAEFAEFKKAVEEEAEKKVQLSEMKIALLEEKNQEKEDLMFFNELVASGKKVMSEKDAVLRKLKVARKSGIMKLSETENYNHYEEARKELMDSPQVIQYGEIGHAGNQPDNATTPAMKAKELAVEKMKSGKSRHEAYSEASIESGYRTIKSAPRNSYVKTIHR